MSRKSNKPKILIVTLLSFLLFTIIYFTLGPIMGHHSVSSKRTRVKAQVNNVALASLQYYSDFHEYPSGFNVLNGKNSTKKVYYTGETVNLKGGEIHIVYDLDYDGKVIINSEEIETRVAVWTKYKNEVINSWEK